jgi:spore germination protein YaaH
MPSRRASLGLLLLILAGCGSPAAGGSPAGSPRGLVVVTAGGTALDDGTTDVPPTLELGLEGSGVTPSMVSASLDGHPLTLTSSSRGVTASVAPMAYASEHQLVIDVAGRPQEEIGFQVVDETGVSAAAWRGTSGQVVCQVVFERAPDRAALAAALPQAQFQWTDGTHLSLAWAMPPPSLAIPAGLAAARGSVLDGPLTLSLTGLTTGHLRRATVPAAAPAPAGLKVTLWTIDDAASNGSAQAHAAATAVLSPTGWEAQADGSLQGSPDPATLVTAQAAGRPVWALLANDKIGAAGTDQLLNSPTAQSALVAAVAAGVRTLHLAGVNLDFEDVPGSDEAALTAFAGALATGLHAEDAGLSVDVIPHTEAGVNSASAAYDDPGLAAVADHLVVLAYDEHTAPGDPGPVAGLAWQAAELAGSLVGVAADKVILGIPLYARSWSGAQVTSGGYAPLVADALSEPGVAYDYDFAEATPELTSAPGGVPTQLWFDDADSLLRKVAAVGQLGLAGIATWRAGFEDPAFWSVI